MALWGKLVNQTGTGTIDVIEDDKNIEGANTDFETELSTGNSLVAAGEIHKVVVIVDSDTLVVNEPPEANATAEAFTYSQTPAWLSDTELSTVVKRTTANAQNSTNRNNGERTPGWVDVKTYVDQNSVTRRRVETLVAFKS
jgi:hypothetical protein